MTLMIALVGEQPLPNFLPLRYYQSADALTDPLKGVLLVYTKKTEEVYKRLRAKLVQGKFEVHKCLIGAYDIAHIVKSVNAELENLKAQHLILELTPHSLLFNFTGGTKPMSLALHQVARKYKAPLFYMESEGKENQIYSYEWKGDELVQKTIKPLLLPECMNLRDFFDIHFGIGEWEVEGRAGGEGGLFEEAVAKVLCEGGYEDVMVGIRAMGQVEIDVAVRFKNQVAIMQLKTRKGVDLDGIKQPKTEKGADLDGIKQLHTDIKYLGDYTRMFYIINIEPGNTPKALCEAAGINVIPLKSYKREIHGSKLPPEEVTKLLSAVGEVLGKGT